MILFQVFHLFSHFPPQIEQTGGSCKVNFHHLPLFPLFLPCLHCQEIKATWWQEVEEDFFLLLFLLLLSSNFLFPCTFLAARAALYLHRCGNARTSGQITSNINTEVSWWLYDIRQPPTSLCTTSNFFLVAMVIILAMVMVVMMVTVVMVVMLVTVAMGRTDRTDRKDRKDRKDKTDI